MGSLSLMTLSVEPGRRGSLSLGIMIPVYNQGDRGHLSLGIVMLTVEPGGLGSFVSRNNDYIEKNLGESGGSFVFKEY